MYLPQSTAIRLIAYTIGEPLSSEEKKRYDYYLDLYGNIVAEANSAHHAISAEVNTALGAGDRVRVVAALTVAAALPVAPADVQVEELPA